MNNKNKLYTNKIKNISKGTNSDEQEITPSEHILKTLQILSLLSFTNFTYKERKRGKRSRVERKKAKIFATRSKNR